MGSSTTPVCPLPACLPAYSGDSDNGTQRGGGPACARPSQCPFWPPLLQNSPRPRSPSQIRARVTCLHRDPGVLQPAAETHETGTNTATTTGRRESRAPPAHLSAVLLCGPDRGYCCSRDLRWASRMAVSPCLLQPAVRNPRRLAPPAQPPPPCLASEVATRDIRPALRGHHHSHRGPGRGDCRRRGSPGSIKPACQTRQTSATSTTMTVMATGAPCSAARSSDQGLEAGWPRATLLQLGPSAQVRPGGL